MICLRGKILSEANSKLLKEWNYNKNDFSPSDVTLGSNKLAWWICCICGNEWQATIKNRVKGSGCPICGINRAHEKTKHSTKEFIAMVSKVNTNIEIVGEYQSMNKKIKCRCRDCQYEWEALPHNLLHGSGCPKCSRVKVGSKRTKTNEQFVKELMEVNENIIPKEKYRNEKTKIFFYCKICGNSWKARPDAILRGQGCPSCNHTNTSFFEKLIFECLKVVFHDNEVISRDRKTIGFELDVFIPSLKIAIEYGAWYWHKKQIKKDNEKRDRCKLHNIRLITIYDGCGFDRDDNNDILYYSNPIGISFDYSKQVIYKIFEIINANYTFSENEWKKLRNLAYLSSRRKITNEFIKEMKEIDPTIAIMGEYHSNKEPIEVKCQKCGKTWITKPNYLLSGNGCPKCNNGMKSHEEFLDIVKSYNPSINIIGEYKGSLNTIECSCNICGYHWTPKATNLLHGYGCPQCAKKVQLKSQNEFEEEIKLLHPNIVLLEEYKGSLTPISCKCKICGNVWKPLPSNLLAGRNCPKCAYSKRRKSNHDFLEEMKEKHTNIEIIGDYVNNNTKILCRCKKCGFEWMISPKSLLKGSGCKRCNIEKRSKSKSIPVINLTTEIIYSSMTIAEQETGVNRNSISNCCRGKQETAGGFKWKFFKTCQL